MKQFFKVLFDKINLSILSNNNTSSSRLQGYLVLVPILVMCYTFLGIEITSFIIAMVHGKTYVLSSEIVIVFGMMLSHHLALVFSKRKSAKNVDASEPVIEDEPGMIKS